MPFLDKFCSDWKYYNITHGIPDLVFKSVCPFNINPEKCLPVQIKQLEQRLKYVCS